MNDHRYVVDLFLSLARYYIRRGNVREACDSMISAVHYMQESLARGS